MEIIKKGVMEDGTKIQIEDWSEDYPALRNKNDMVVVYPMAKESFEGSFGPVRNKTFRLEIVFENADEAFIAYNRLIQGTKSILYYKGHFYKREFIKCLR